VQFPGVSTHLIADLGIPPGKTPVKRSLSVTARTRRRIVVSLVVLALTLPVESVLLQAVSTDAKTAAFEWAASLSPDELVGIGDQVASFPTLYRRAIMRAATPELRSRFWRKHLNRYINTHPDLSTDALGLLYRAIDLASPENLGSSSPEARAEMKSVGDQLQVLLGKEDAQEALYRLGPRDGTFNSLEPTSLKLSNWVREKFVALAAAMARDCDCRIDWSCDGGGTCKAGTGCTPDEDWPACGWFWNETCDGTCATISMS